MYCIMRIYSFYTSKTGNSILEECKELKSQIDIAQRQINAAENTSRSKVSTNPKYSAYVKQKESATKVRAPVPTKSRYNSCCYC